MKYKTIEASREVRLWIGQVIVPAAAAVVAVLSIPGMKDSLAEKAKDGREKIKNKFNK